MQARSQRGTQALLWLLDRRAANLSECFAGLRWESPFQDLPDVTGPQSGTRKANED